MIHNSQQFFLAEMNFKSSIWHRRLIWLAEYCIPHHQKWMVWFNDMTGLLTRYPAPTFSFPCAYQKRKKLFKIIKILLLPAVAETFEFVYVDWSLTFIDWNKTRKNVFFHPVYAGKLGDKKNLILSPSFVSNFYYWLLAYHIYKLF